MNVINFTKLFKTFSCAFRRVYCVAAILVLCNMGVIAQEGIWRDLAPGSMTGTGKTYIVPQKYRALSVDMNALKSYLSQAPVEAENGNYSKTFYFTFPMPDGTNQKFWVVQSSIMEPELAAKYPEIKTFGGQGIDDPTATVRFDYTQKGFHAMILSAHGSYFIDPYFFNETVYHISYDKKDYVKAVPLPPCGVQAESVIDPSLEKKHLDGKFQPNQDPVLNKSIGSQLRTYSLALATTGEYTTFHGGTAGAIAAVATSVNRVVGIYEREVAVRMVLVANNNLIIYANSGTDPYTNNNGSTMLAQNQSNLNTVIGSANYDIGHVFSTGGGGIAGKGVVCNNASKGRGVTGSPQPVGDPFDVDYVAHEMGHQFDGNHTFNSESGFCGGGNRAFTAAYEPGSGSTIMAYAGICSPNDLQSNSNAYFHTKSFDEITIYTFPPGVGNACATLTATGNSAPVINPGANYIIPYSTPFKLTGSATDPDNDTITYCWEEYDLGAPCNWNAPVGNSPIFRSFSPTLSPTRLFPKLSSILNNIQAIGEIKPSYARTLKFKLTCRDNKFGGGGVTNNDTPVNIQVINTGTPFAITAPNTTGIVYNSLSLETITWDVGATDVAPISSPNVNIYLSTDGGQTFPIPLGTNVPNTGSYQWWTPLISTSTARVWVEGAGNVFFDINDKNFTISGTVGINETELSNSVNVYPNPGHGLYHFAIDNSYQGPVQVSVYDKIGRLISRNDLIKSAQLMNHNLNLASEVNGFYSVEFTFDTGKVIKRLVKL